MGRWVGVPEKSLRSACERETSMCLIDGVSQTHPKHLLTRNLTISLLPMCLFSSNRDGCGEYQIKREDLRPLSTTSWSWQLVVLALAL